MNLLRGFKDSGPIQCKVSYQFLDQGIEKSTGVFKSGKKVVQHRGFFNQGIEYNTRASLCTETAKRSQLFTFYLLDNFNLQFFFFKQFFSNLVWFGKVVRRMAAQERTHYTALAASFKPIIGMLQQLHLNQSQVYFSSFLQTNHRYNLAATFKLITGILQQLPSNQSQV